MREQFRTVPVVLAHRKGFLQDIDGLFLPLQQAPNSAPASSSLSNEFEDGSAGFMIEDATDEVRALRESGASSEEIVRNARSLFQ